VLMFSFTTTEARSSFDSVTTLTRQTAERGSQRDLVSIIERIVGGNRRNEHRVSNNQYGYYYLEYHHTIRGRSKVGEVGGVVGVMVLYNIGCLNFGDFGSQATDNVTSEYFPRMLPFFSLKRS
jgi:hypothetical protein